MNPPPMVSRIAPLAAVWALSACAAVVSFDEYGTSSAPRAFRIVGIAQGLEGNRATIALRDEKLVVEDGPFSFASGLIRGTPYEVVIVDSPAAHSCAIERARGTVESRDMDVELRCFSTNAELSSLAVDGAPLAPAFEPAILEYSATLPSAGFLVSKMTTATITAIATRNDARVTIASTPPSPGTVSAPVTLSGTATPADVVVTAPDGRTTRRYRVLLRERVADWMKGAQSQENTLYGTAVAASGDRFVVGAPFEQPTTEGSRGAAYVYVRKGNDLLPDGRLTLPNEEAFRLGESVAIAGDRLVLGAPRAGLFELKERGTIYLFGRGPAGWSFSSDPMSSILGGNEGAHCGEAIAMTATRVVVGCPGWQTYWSARGAGGVVQVHDISGACCSRTTFINPSYDPNGSLTAGGFGAAVAIDGDTVAVGSPNNYSGATGIDGNLDADVVESSGSVSIYTWDAQGSSWQLQAFIKPPKNEPNSRFGHALALSKDSLVVARTSAVEEVFVYRRVGTTWSLETTLTAPNAAAHRVPRFGSSVAIVDDVIAVGAPGDSSDAVGIDGDETNDRRSASGAVFLFRRSGASWTKSSYVKATVPFVNGFFGRSIGITPTRLVVGSPSESAKATGVNPTPAAGFVRQSGAAYVY